MKKIIIFFIIIVCILSIISMWYINWNISYNEAKKQNKEYEYYYKKEVYGTEVASIINRAYDNNIKNNVERNNKNKFISNNENSIKIDIYMIDMDNTYDLETLYAGGIQNFIYYYSTIQFKLTKIEYHKTTGKVKYLYFKQITQ